MISICKYCLYKISSAKLKQKEKNNQSDWCKKYGTWCDKAKGLCEFKGEF